MCVICSCLALLPFLELKWGVPGLSLIPQFHIFGVYLCFLFFFLQKKNSISVLLLVFTISTVSSFLWFFFVFVWSVTPLLLGTTLQLYVLLAASHTFRDLRWKPILVLLTLKGDHSRFASGVYTELLFSWWLLSFESLLNSFYVSFFCLVVFFKKPVGLRATSHVIP